LQDFLLDLPSDFPAELHVVDGFTVEQCTLFLHVFGTCLIMVYIMNLKITFLSDPDTYRKAEYSGLHKLKTISDSSWVVAIFFHNAIEH
jgi:hypothetical protein